MSSNGMLTSRELGTIPGTSHRVRKDLVVQTAALRAAFEKRFRKPLALTDSYRPYSVQVRLFTRNFTTNYAASAKTDRRVWDGRVWWRAYRPGTRTRWPSASTPGNSNHGWGTAIDWSSNVNVGGSDEQKWMAANAHRFGWNWPVWARNPRNAFYEPWHYEAVPVPVAAYRTYLTEHRITVPDVPALAPLTPTRRRLPTMVIIQYGSRYRAISGDRLVGIGPDDVPGFVAAGVPLVQVGKDTWENFRAGFTPEG